VYVCNVIRVSVRASDPKRALSMKVKVDLLVCTVCM